MWRVPTERVLLDLDGPTVEVERLHSWHVASEMAALRAAFFASTEAAEYTALTRLYDLFIEEAQPSWDIVDHRGAVPPTGRGLARLPLTLGINIVSLWLNDFAAEAQAPQEPASAVDAIIPPGELNTALKRRLATAKRRKAA